MTLSWCGILRNCFKHCVTNGDLQMAVHFKILLAVCLCLQIDKGMTDWLPLAPALTFSTSSPTPNSDWREDCAWDCGALVWKQGLLLMLAFQLGIAGLAGSCVVFTNSSAKGWMSVVSWLVCSSTCCNGCRQETEQVVCDPQHWERNAATSYASEEANIIILSYASMTRASSTY